MSKETIVVRRAIQNTEAERAYDEARLNFKLFRLKEGSTEDNKSFWEYQLECQETLAHNQIRWQEESFWGEFVDNDQRYNRRKQSHGELSISP